MNTDSKVTYVRFPNESYFEEILHFDWHRFTPTHEFEDEIFGTYAGMTIAIKKDVRTDSSKLDKTEIKDS